MANRLISTKDLIGSKVRIEKPKKKKPEKTKKLGRVRTCVFHPEKKRCVGFIVKRPDLLLMFHRHDVFVAYDGYDMAGKTVVVHKDPKAVGKGACKALGINLDDCVFWIGLPVMCEDGTEFGLVGSVSYDEKTGNVEALTVSQGATANVLLGQRNIPASMIRGFRRGMGTALASIGEDGKVAEDDDETACGAVLVDDAVKKSTVEGGLAERAGAATAVIGYRAHQAMESAKPAANNAAAAVGDVVNKGAYATGRQIKRASGMFAEFKYEYDKASGKLDKKAPSQSSSSASGAKTRTVSTASKSHTAAKTTSTAASGAKTRTVSTASKSHTSAKAASASAKSTTSTASASGKTRTASGASTTKKASSTRVASTSSATRGASTAGRKSTASTAGRKGTASAAGTANKKKSPAASTEAEESQEGMTISAQAARAVDKQLDRASGMFSAFLDEYKKARNGQ